jgi:hypothetical protein
MTVNSYPMSASISRRAGDDDPSTTLKGEEFLAMEDAMAELIAEL